MHTHPPTYITKNCRIKFYCIYYKLKDINLNLSSIKSDKFVEINKEGIIDQTKIIINKKAQNMYDQIIFIKTNKLTCLVLDLGSYQILIHFLNLVL